MKTQRPRDRVNQRQTPDGSSLADGSTETEDGASQAQENGEEVGTRRNQPPALPKRKAARPAQPQSKPAGNKGGDGVAVADAEAPSASAPKRAERAAQPEVPVSAQAEAG